MNSGTSSGTDSGTAGGPRVGGPLGGDGESAHLAIERRLRQLAATRPVGERLPSTRTLVLEHAASPLTVQRALQRLVLEGLVETRPGAGSFVARRHGVHRADFGWQTTALGTARTGADSIGAALASAGPGVISLHSGYPAEELLPTRLVRSALVRAARTSSAVERAPLAGLPELLTWFAAELAPAGASAVAPPTADDVVITPGGQSALSSIFRALAAPGDAIVMESPTYWGAMAAARQAGLRVVPIARGATAPAAADLDDALGASGARLFYAQPHFANPTGALWGSDDRAALLAVVRARGVYLIEDDWAHDFGIDAQPEPVAARDDSGHVIYVRSLSKSISPSIRVAAVIARGPVRDRILADNGAEAMYVSGLLQAAALDVVTHPGWSTHRRSLAQQLRTRRDLLVSSLHRHAQTVHLETIPRGGLNLWGRLPDGTDVQQLVARCESRGLLITSGDESFSAEPSGPYVRLNYAGPDPGAFDEAARRLGSELASIG